MARKKSERKQIKPRKIPANKQLARHFKSGKTKKKFVCSILEISEPTLRTRMKDNKFKSYQLDKLEAEGLYTRG